MTRSPKYDLQKYTSQTSPLRSLKAIGQMQQYSGLRKNFVVKLQYLRRRCPLPPLPTNGSELKASAALYNIPQLCPPEVSFEVSEHISAKVREMVEGLQDMPQSKSSNFAPWKAEHQVSHRAALLELQGWLRLNLKHPPQGEALQYKNMIMAVGMQELIRIVKKRCLEEGEMLHEVWELTWGICRAIIVHFADKIRDCEQTLQEEISFLKRNYQHHIQQLQQQNATIQLNQLRIRQTSQDIQRENTKLEQRNGFLEEDNRHYLFDNATLEEQLEKSLEENLALFMQVGGKSCKQWVRKVYLQNKNKSIGKYANKLANERIKIDGEEEIILQGQNQIQDQEKGCVNNNINSDRKKQKNEKQNAQIEQINSLIKNLHSQFKQSNAETQFQQFENENLLKKVQYIDQQVQSEFKFQSVSTDTDDIEILIPNITISPQKQNRDDSKEKTKQNNKSKKHLNLAKNQKNITKNDEGSKKKTKIDSHNLKKKIGQKIKQKSQKNKSLLKSKFQIQELQNQTIKQSSGTIDKSKKVLVQQQNKQNKQTDLQCLNQNYLIANNKFHNSSCQQLNKKSCQINVEEQDNKVNLKNEQIAMKQNSVVNPILFNQTNKTSIYSNAWMQDKIQQNSQEKQQDVKQELMHSSRALDSKKEKSQKERYQISSQFGEQASNEAEYDRYKRYSNDLTLQQDAISALLSESMNVDSREDRKEAKKRKSGYLHDIVYKKQLQKSHFAQPIQDCSTSTPRLSQAFLSIQKSPTMFNHFIEKIFQENKQYLKALKEVPEQAIEDMENYFDIVKDMNAWKMQLSEKYVINIIEKTIFPILGQLKKYIRKAATQGTLAETARNFTSLPTIVYRRMSRKYGMKNLAIKNFKILLSAIRQADKFTEKYRIIELMMFTNCRSTQSEDLFVYLIIMSMMDPLFNENKLLSFEEKDLLKSICRQYLTTYDRVYVDYDNLIAGKKDVHLHQAVGVIISSYRMTRISRIQELGFIFQMFKQDGFMEYQLFMYFIWGFKLAEGLQIGKKILDFCQVRHGKIGLSEFMFSKFLITCQHFTLNNLISNLNITNQTHHSISSERNFETQTNIPQVKNPIIQMEKCKNYSSFVFKICSYLEDQEQEKYLSAEQKKLLKDYIAKYILQKQICQILGLIQHFSSETIQLLSIDNDQYRKK